MNLFKYLVVAAVFATALTTGNNAQALTSGWKLTGMRYTKISSSYYGDGSSAVTCTPSTSNNPLEGTSDASAGSTTGNNGATISYDFSFDVKYSVAGMNPGVAPVWTTKVIVTGFHDSGGWGITFDGGGISLNRSTNITISNSSGGTPIAERTETYHTSNEAHNFSPHTGADASIDFTCI